MLSGNKKTFLREKYNKMSQQDFDTLIEVDKTGKTTEWILRIFQNGGLRLSELEILKNVIKEHSKIKDTLPIELRDINRFDTLVEYLHAYNKFISESSKENSKKLEYLSQGAELIAENEDFTIVKVLTYDGSVNFGSLTGWCTLRRDSYTTYANQGDLYILTNKTNRYKKILGTKTQLFFGGESKSEEFKNNDNKDIELIQIICSNPELYQHFKFTHKIKIKNQKTHAFFKVNTVSSKEKCEIIKKNGMRILQFIDEFNGDLLNELFFEFGDKVFEHIPHSENKLISYVANVEHGLKELLKDDFEITEEIFRASVKHFGSNILLMPNANGNMWLDAIRSEPWLVKNSSWINDTNALYNMVFDLNILVLKYIKPTTIFSVEQLQSIAEYVVKLPTMFDKSATPVHQFKTILPLLGKFDVDFQLKLITLSHECVCYLIEPSDEAIKLAGELKKSFDLTTKKLAKSKLTKADEPIKKTEEMDSSMSEIWRKLKELQQDTAKYKWINGTCYGDGSPYYNPNGEPILDYNEIQRNVEERLKLRDVLSSKPNKKQAIQEDEGEIADCDFEEPNDPTGEYKIISNGRKTEYVGKDGRHYSSHAQMDKANKLIKLDKIFKETYSRSDEEYMPF